MLCRSLHKSLPYLQISEVTTYFNSISQERLQQNERGRFIAGCPRGQRSCKATCLAQGWTCNSAQANIMTVFTLGSSLGTLIFGWAKT